MHIYSYVVAMGTCMFETERERKRGRPGESERKRGSENILF